MPYQNPLRSELKYTIGYMPEANGIAERCKRTIFENCPALRIEVGLPEEFQEFVFNITAFIRNHGPVSNRDIIPWEA